MRSQALQAAGLIASNRLSSLRNLKLPGNIYIKIVGDNMKTLSEYEHTRREIREQVTEWVGVACDHCGAELYNPTPGVVLMSSPPKINVSCSKCVFTGYMTK